MLDLRQLTTIDIKQLTEEEADRWCEKLLNFTPSGSESNTSLIGLFQFTRGLLQVKQVQAEVLVEELQNFESKLENVGKDFDQLIEMASKEQKTNKLEHQDSSDSNLEQSKKEIDKLQQELQAKDGQLELERKRNVQLETTLKQRDKELDSLHREMVRQREQLMESNTEQETESGPDEDDKLGEQAKLMRAKLNEKNLQIEQLLDKQYDSDRIALDLAEQVAKYRLEQAKLRNDLRIAESRAEMLTAQLEQISKLNHSLVEDRERRQQQLEMQIQMARNQLTTSTDGAERGEAGSTNVERRYMGELGQKIEQLTVLLEVKDNEISDLRSLLSERVANSDRERELILKQKRSEIEQLEQELAILVSKKNISGNKNVESGSGQESAREAQLKRRVDKLKRDKLTLLKKIDDLEREAKHKDELLERLRHRTVDRDGGGGQRQGGGTAVELAEENAVLSRMIRYRDGRINFLIEQLNRNQLTALECDTADGQEKEDEISSKKKKKSSKKKSNLSNLSESVKERSESDLSHKEFSDEIPLMDQLIAMEVERDILGKQLEGLRQHCESIQKENQELQLGMKEILDGIRHGDQQNDLIIECPSLERLCLLLENRFITDSSTGTGTEDFTKFILLKSELDFVRGQNEQLRAELKQVRTDFLSVIDEYTADILQNWTIPDVGTSSSARDTITNDQMEDRDSSQMSLTVTIDAQSQTTAATTTTDMAIQNEKQVYNDIDGGGSLSKSISESATQTEDEAEEVDKDQDQVEVVGHPQQTPVSKNIQEVSKRRKTIKQLKKRKLRSGTQKISGQEPAIHTKVPKPKLIDSTTQTTIGQQNRSIQTMQVTLVMPGDEYEEEEISEKVSRNDSVIDTENSATQTIELGKVSIGVGVSLTNDCRNCSKYLSMLTTVRELIGKEREQIRMNELRLTQQIELANYNLKLIHKEYLLDIEAKNEEIKDLRNKLLLSISSSSSSSVGSSGTVVRVQAGSPSNLEPAVTGTNDRSQSKTVQVQNKGSVTNGHGLNLIEHLEETGNQGEDTSQKHIVDSIVTCLQNCLRQKDETLSEYRQLIDEMRLNYYRTMQNPNSDLEQNQEAEAKPVLGLPPPPPTISQQENLMPIQRVGMGQDDSTVDTIYNELFVKPCVKENEELIGLLRNAFHQLKILQTESKAKIESLQRELVQSGSQCRELRASLESTTKELEHCTRVLRMSEAKEKLYQDKVDSLTGRIGELTNRQASSAASLNNYRKKVQNEVFQESADLRVKVAELTVQIRKAEVDRWTAEKKLTQERQQNREKMLAQEEMVAQLTQQNTKLQTVMAKLEKRLFLQQQTLQKKSAADLGPKATVTRSTQTERPNSEQSTRTATTNRKVVRFSENPVESSRTYDVDNAEPILVGPDSGDEEDMQQHRQNSRLAPQVEEKVPCSKTLIEDGCGDNDNEDNGDQSMEQSLELWTIVDKDRMIGELQLLLEKCYKRDRMDSALNEITTVAGQVLPDCPGQLTTEQIYEQLIDMQFERLVTENAQLKVKLKIYQIINHQDGSGQYRFKLIN